MEKRQGHLFFRFIKRTFDIFVSGFGLILSSPFMLLAVILIKIGSPGPILFRQQRLGKDEVPFTIYKFRTMKIDANPNVGAEDLHDEYKNMVPKFALFLRKSRIDELPQLWNIFRGDMSFVGPRPQMSKEYELPLYEERKKYSPSPFMVRPGLTGLAQVKMNCTHDIDRKAKYDAEYVQNFTLFQDFKIFFATIPMLIRLILKKRK